MRASIIREDFDLNHLTIGKASVWLTDREIKDLVHDVSQYVYDNRLFFGLDNYRRIIL